MTTRKTDDEKAAAAQARKAKTEEKRAAAAAAKEAKVIATAAPEEGAPVFYQWLTQGPVVNCEPATVTAVHQSDAGVLLDLTVRPARGTEFKATGVREFDPRFPDACPRWKPAPAVAAPESED